MCGIAGIVNYDQSNGLHKVDKLLEALNKRGPDDKGVLVFPRCILGHTRLSIIDLVSGHQPMSDDSDISITFNGEIYNYKKLRSDLEKKNHLFKTNSDTEVILKLYLEYKEHCVDFLDGMFAFGIWDSKKDELFLARDRFGEKPLYYSIINNELIFASEIKALIKAGVSTDLDLKSVDNYLALLYIPPWRTIYTHIRQLPPAHYITFQDGIIKCQRYWNLKKKSNKHIDLSEAKKIVHNIISESVKTRMVADVEVGTFLSGGIDSSIVTRVASHISPNIQSFSLGFGTYINELPYAESIAKITKTRHHSTNLSETILQLFKSTVSYFDTPFADSSNMATQYLSKYASSRVKVVLSGDGADEIFWGYGHAYTRHHHLPFLKRMCNLFFSNPLSSFINHIQHFKPYERRLLWKDKRNVEDDPTIHVDLTEADSYLDKINLIDIYMCLPGDILTKVDQSSMMHSLEVRSPFLNHALAEIAFNLPPEYKATSNSTKIILKEAFKKVLPQEILSRKKQGFGAPIDQWLNDNEIKSYLKELLLHKNSNISTFLNDDYIVSIVNNFYSGDTTLKHKLWILFTLEEWLRTHNWSISN